MSEWIGVKDKLPKDDEYVLTYDGYSICTACIFYWEEGNPVWMSPPAPPFEATHWMPLPKPPNQD